MIENKEEIGAGVPRVAKLEITFARYSPTDGAGCFDMNCRGVEEWMYANIGQHHGMQGAKTGEDPRVMEFGDKIAALVREFFKDIPPILKG